MGDRPKHVGWRIYDHAGSTFVEVPESALTQMRALALLRGTTPEVLLAVAWRWYFAREQKRFNGESSD